MAGRLEGKTAVVTAAGQGIGRAIVEAFVAEGATVYASDLDRSKLAGLAAAKTHGLDVTSTAAVQAYAAEIGTINILCNVAGYVHHGTVLECDDKAWDFSFDLNVKSIHRMLAAFLPGMLANGGGSVINLASAASSIKGAPNRYVYGATKAAVIGLTKATAQDFITKGIRVNAICPGTIESPSLNERIETLGQSVGGADKARAMFIARQPMGRIADAAEIGPLAVYLASDESRFVTGGAHLIDGGWTL
jgi:2-keto-3-deoxy-L-fuconate dehydrogenase